MEWIEQIARVTALRSTCPRAAVGAVLFDSYGIYSVSFNGAPRSEPHCLNIGCLMDGGHCLRASHAEVNLIASAAREGIAVGGKSIYVTHRACIHCQKLMLAAGIKRYYWGIDYGPPIEHFFEGEQFISLN